ncbi:hypothetical protein DV735_g679, partial [Chaetothyriales sp. CBS 134920]
MRCLSPSRPVLFAIAGFYLVLALILLQKYTAIGPINRIVSVASSSTNVSSNRHHDTADSDSIDGHLFSTVGETAPAHTRLLAEQASFCHSLFSDIDRFRPRCPRIVHPEDTGLDIGYNASLQLDRPDILRLSRKQQHELHFAHTKFVSRLKEGEYNLPYNKGTQGIVTTAGGPYLEVALVSVRMLRRTGSDLPVEIFLGSQEEFDPQICGVVLPSLNARCIVLDDIFTRAGLSTVKIDKYQYKIMSILFSSFEDVLFLDSDCFPIYAPDDLMNNEPFATSGLVIWPDFWFPSESPLFFDIAEIDAPDVWTRASSESGEMLYSKSKHDISLMLAAYYNYYGPDFYYPLQSQGAPGEGDKETFLWAAVAVGAPFYHVRTPLRALGYFTTEGEWRGSAMLQADPMDDFERSIEDLYGETTNLTEPRPFFIHANFPKFRPSTIFTDKSFGAQGPTRDADGTMRRVWHENGAASAEVFGFDLERRLWEEIRDIGCEYESVFDTWHGVNDICTNATVYWQTVIEADDSLS